MKKEVATKIIQENIDLFTYGGIIHESDFIKMFDIKLTSEQFYYEQMQQQDIEAIFKLKEQDDLAELSISGLVREILQDDGKQLIKSGNHYRVALPSENEFIAQKYRSRAAKALNRAKRLTDNTPKEFTGHKDTSKSMEHILNQKINKVDSHPD
jgi:hypothetical protein